MKLALHQGPAIGGATEETFGVIQSRLAAAAAAGARMIVFPELFLPGYNRPDLHGPLAQPQGGAWCQRLSALARAAGCGLAIGWAERDGERTYNAASCFSATGERIAHYRKIQLFGPMENTSFQPGSGYCLFEMEGLRAALLICYDVEFAPHCRALAKQGVELILVPTANPAGFEHVSALLVPARAVEMGLTIAYANYCGSEGDINYAGRSVIAGPDGQALAVAGPGETLLVTDLAATAAIPQTLLSRQLDDYRTPQP